VVGARARHRLLPAHPAVVRRDRRPRDGPRLVAGPRPATTWHVPARR
jgi:hypothetical protein